MGKPNTFSVTSIRLSSNLSLTWIAQQSREGVAAGRAPAATDSLRDRREGQLHLREVRCAVLGFVQTGHTVRIAMCEGGSDADTQAPGTDPQVVRPVHRPRQEARS
jgi:hypothetical protein